MRRPKIKYVDTEKNLISNDKEKSGFSSHALSNKHLALFLLFLGALKWLAHLETNRLPTVQTETAEDNKLGNELFSTARARSNLQNIVKFGVRMAGSVAADELTAGWILNHLSKLKQQLDSKPSRKFDLTFEADHVSGFFELEFPAGYTSVYNNVTNVLARIDPVAGDHQNAVLVNCHYDSYYEVL